MGYRTQKLGFESSREWALHTELVPGAEEFADELFRLFLNNHLDDKLDKSLTLDSMRQMDNLIQHGGCWQSFADIAAAIRIEANRAAELAVFTHRPTPEVIAMAEEAKHANDRMLASRAGSLAYEAWRRRRENNDMIATDYGAIRPDTDFDAMNAYENWRRANIGSVALDVAISSPASAEDFAEAA